MPNCPASARPPIPLARAIDTIEIAKRKIPGARYSLDELCKRFGIDLSARTKHGALLDAELTAQIYLELVGGRQKRLLLAPVEIAPGRGHGDDPHGARSGPNALPSRITEAEARSTMPPSSPRNWATRCALELSYLGGT